MISNTYFGTKQGQAVFHFEAVRLKTREVVKRNLLLSNTRFLGHSRRNRVGS